MMIQKNRHMHGKKNALPVREDAPGKSNATIHGTMPDKTFLLMLDPNKSKDRIVRELDRLESEPYEYHDRVYKGYEKIAEENPDRVVRIDGEKSIECIAEIIIEEVRKII